MRWCFAFSFAFFSSSSFAHIELDFPLNRYDQGDNGDDPDGEVNKSCPCGDGAGNQTCSNGVTTDDNRDADRVTTFAPGEHIVVRWRETIGHSGRVRVAFSADGADLDAFNANILADEADPRGGAGNTGDGNKWELDVVLPDEPCDNCVLQLIQDMNGNVSDPVLDPRGDDTYFQCADLILTAEGEGEGEGEEGEGEEGEGEGEAPGFCGSSGLGSIFALVVLLRRRRNA